jgi:hypothetical protein
VTTGPDVAAIQCYEPDGCCGPGPCDIDQETFICQLRALLPEGDLYNTSLPATLPTPARPAQTGITVGCSTVGRDQLVSGGCCDEGLECDDEPVAPQLALLDSFSAVAYGAVRSLCDMLRELDPCSADVTLRRWAERFGIVRPGCNGPWSDDVLKVLVCIIPQIKLHVVNWEFLTALAARFGANINLHHAGDFNCGPVGWWTMARDADECPPAYSCPPDNPGQALRNGIIMPLTGTCIGRPDSLNLVISPADITIPGNCNIPPGTAITLPHDDELYEAFKWLLPMILPRPHFWCVYERDESNCIV